MLCESLVALSIGLASLGPAQSPVNETPPAVAAKSASFRFSPETLDLGEMIAGTPKSGTLTITNITGAPLTIAKIAPACGCTTIANAPDGPLPAGSSVTLTITVDPGFKSGVDLSKAVRFAMEGGEIETYTIKGHVKTVVRVSPDVVDASLVPDGAVGVVTLESVDGAPFTISAIEPAGIVALPGAASARHALSIDWKAWDDLGRPGRLTITTDKREATTLVLPIKLAATVALFRLPAAEPGSRERSRLESAQNGVLHAIDDALAASGHSPEFRIKLHRETGLLFVHGTEADLTRVREAITELPVEAGVRESGH